MSRRLSRVPVTVFRPGSRAGRRFDDVTAEEPLAIRVGGRTLAVTMRTPGDDFDLAAGFLTTEGALGPGARLREMRYCADTEAFNTLDVDVEGPVVWHERATVASAACGVCGKTSIDDVRRRTAPIPPGPAFAVAAITAAPQALASQQAAFRRTGGIHAAGLMDVGGRLECVREDVGRHNAVDKVIGWAALDDRLPLHQSGLVVSGRAGFEIVQKAAVAGIPLLAAVGAPSSLAVEVAAEVGMTLCGFVRGGGMNVYSCPERLSG
jgi:FdhD protein